MRRNCEWLYFPGQFSAALVVSIGWLCGSVSFALDPSLRMTQYAHTSWTPQSAGLPGTILAITQTTDANLWIGTETGLFRFDGVRFRPWEPAAGQQLSGEPVLVLTPSRDGSLWIGRKGGLSHWKNDRLENYATGSGSVGPNVSAILEDHNGVVWVGTVGFRAGGLCRVEKSSLRCLGAKEGVPELGVSSLFEDGQGRLWLGGVGGLWMWTPAGHNTYPLRGPLAMVHSMVQDPHGETWVSNSGEDPLLQLVGGKLTPYRGKLGGKDVQPRALLPDRDGGLWIGTSGQGLVHLAGGRLDRFTHADGLSNDIVRCLFEDKEGDVWVGTDGGLDRFREFAVTTVSRAEGLSGNLVTSVYASSDGEVWLGTGHGLDGIQNEKITVLDDRNGLPSQSITAIFEDRSGTLWVDSTRGLAYRESGRFHIPDQPFARNTTSIIAAGEDRDHTIWLSEPSQGLLRLQDRRLIETVPWSKFQNSPALALEPDDRGGIWLGFAQGGLLHYEPGRSSRWYTPADGLAQGPVVDLHMSRNRTLWIATQAGLSRLQDGHIKTLGIANGLPCEKIHAVVEDDGGALWLNTACGLIRIGSADLAAWFAKPQDKVRMKVYGAGDGMRIHPAPSGYFRRAAKSNDGRLWFVVLEGVAVVDPKHLPENHLAPPVEIEEITADHKFYAANAALQLPPLTKELQIDYTALSFVAPEKVVFRYKLEGFDPQWREVSRRQAVYTNLPPKHYQFHVVACNNDGVWNQAGASLSFSILPAFYQTTWFGLLMAATLGALSWMLYRLRIRQVARQLSIRYEERLAERTRIARDLHDSLLQNITGFALQLGGLAKTVTSPETAKEQLHDLRQQAEKWLRDARESVSNLRRPISQDQDLGAAMQQMGQQLTAGQNVAFRLTVEGARHAASAKIQEQLLSISQEAWRNAIHHGRATEIRTNVSYLDRESIQIKINDDGCGFDLDEASRKTGHWGLTTMRERAQQIGAELRISTAPGRGTVVEIVVPLKSADE